MLGLAWTQDQAGQRSRAVKGYREAFERAWKTEKGLGSGFGQNWSVTVEIAGYLQPLLDPKKDKKELVELEKRVKHVSAYPRAITPILIPLTEVTEIETLINRQAKVAFDLDGTGLERPWGWIRPTAGWLVYSEGEKISSGIQLMGSVSFWIFWEHGYQVLSALDDNRNGELRGRELRGLSIWQDKNSNGKSEVGEVRPLSDWNILALSVENERYSSEFLRSPHGVILKSGKTRPSYDWLISPSDLL